MTNAFRCRFVSSKSELYVWKEVNFTRMNDWIITTLSLQVSSYFDQKRQFLSQLITAVGLLTLEILSNQVTTNKKNVWIAIILLLSIALRMINKRLISVTTFPAEFQFAHFIAQQQNRACAQIPNLFSPFCQMNVGC